MKDSDILNALSGGPLHGYAIRCKIADMTGRAPSAERVEEGC